MRSTMREEDVPSRHGDEVPGGKMKRIMIVAGEASGDLHGANLVAAIKRAAPEVSFYGLGGNRMKAAGVELVADCAALAVVGLTEVISKLPLLMGVMKKLKSSLREEPPDLVILLDYPDFNLPLAKAAKAHGIKVLYYISPQVWAWRKGRIAKIKRFVDRMAVILPFEEEFYRREGVAVTFVGHPLLDAMQENYSRNEARQRLRVEEGGPVIGILPGSRPSEVDALLPDMLAAATLLRNWLPAVRFMLPIADTLQPCLVDGIVKKSGIPVSIVRHAAYDVISACDCVMVASGTATLETALLGTPMVIVYRISPLSYLIGRMFISVDHIGLANIIAGKTVVPELIQKDANPERIASEILGILIDEGKRTRMEESLAETRDKLGTPGAAERTALIACEMMGLRQ
ncbi:MAG: lipid-A-disaccharide synthase [Smithellaceae bacterium]|nr:lipid-A-disaccharide synthase [Smithellaceae bacterium]